MGAKKRQKKNTKCSIPSEDTDYYYYYYNSNGCRCLPSLMTANDTTKEIPPLHTITVPFLYIIKREATMKVDLGGGGEVMME